MRVELRKLLLGQGDTGRRFEALFGPVDFDRALRMLNLLAEFGQALGKPRIGLPRPLEFGVELVENISLGDRIGDPP